MEPLKYQIEVLRALKEARKNGAHSALVVMATGLGKTVVSAFDVEQYMFRNRGRVLFLCHNNGILEQNMGAFQSILDGEFTYGLFNGISKAPEAEFVFASFQTMLDCKEEFAPDTFKYIVVDEAHHAPAETFRKVIKYFRPDFLLGITATPHRHDGLDLEEIFGPITYNLSLTEAIRRGLLVDIHYNLMLDEMVDLDSVMVDGEKVPMRELNRRLFVPRRDEEIAHIIEDKITDLKAGSTLVFCRSIEHAENMSALLKGSQVVHSEKPVLENREIINGFRLGEIPIIVSVDQLNEGIDIPRADLIVFLRSTVSPTVFYQQLGRGLRLHEGKEFATVLDFVGNYWRLEILNTLMEEINHTDGEGDEEDNPHFVLNVNTSQFRQTKVDIAIILERLDRLVFGWSEEELIAQVQMLAKELGKTPTMDEFDKDSRTASRTTVQTYFGSWNQFVKVAGLEVNRRNDISDEELLAQIQMLANELGRTPTMNEFKNDSRTVSADTAKIRFGSWSRFLETAGLEMNRRRQRTIVGNEELVAQVRLLAKELGRAPTAREFDKDPRTANSTVTWKYFGSWNQFLETAGLEVNQRRRILTDDELIAQVRMLANELGRTPSLNEFRKDSRTASVDMAKSRFGSWNQFLETAGLEVNQRRRILTDDELIAQVRMLANELGRTPTMDEFKRNPRTSYIKAVVNHFGTWNRFVEAAGLEINRKWKGETE